MNLTEAIDTEIGTPPPPSFDLQALIRDGLERRGRARRIGAGVGVALCAAVATTAAVAPWPHHSTVRPTATTPQAPPATAFPLPTGSWPAIPLPTGVPPSFDATLARIGPGLGVPAGTKFEYTDLGGTYKIVQASWGSGGSWGNISVDPIGDTSTETYSCAHFINCTEVTGADGSMTYVAGPIVAAVPPATPPAPSTTRSPFLLAPTREYAYNNFVYSYHPDGTFVMITIDRRRTPATLTIEQLIEAGQAFSAAP